MKFLVLVLALVALAQARRGKRQVIGAIVGPIQDPFKNVPNPCLNNPTQQVYFPHPTDNTKFLQCDMYKRMYIIQCPQGEIFVAATTSCRSPQVLTTPVMVTPASVSNPCRSSSQAAGQIYFAVPNDPNHYIECDLLGNANLLVCPNGQLWQQTVVSCVYPQGSGPSVVTSNPLTGGLTNPCTPQAIAANKLYFPHPDPHKFLQCDLWGDVFINTCPTGLVWNAYQEVCANTFQNVVGK